VLEGMGDRGSVVGGNKELRRNETRRSMTPALIRLRETGNTGKFKTSTFQLERGHPQRTHPQAKEGQQERGRSTPYWKEGGFIFNN